MSNFHPRPWHRGSLFTDGPRRSLNREQRRLFYARLAGLRRGGRVTDKAEDVGNALVRHLGGDGRLDPSHETIARWAGCCARTVRRALNDLREIGMVVWQRRIVRAGWRTEQTSNAYSLALPSLAETAKIRAPRCGGQDVRPTAKTVINIPSMVSPAERDAAHSGLARYREAFEAWWRATRGRLSGAVASPPAAVGGEATAKTA